MRMFEGSHLTSFCLSASRKVCIVTGTDTGPASVRRQFRPCFAASWQLMADTAPDGPVCGILSRNPPPSAQATSEYSIWFEALLPNHRTLFTSHFVPVIVISEAAVALTSLLAASWQ